MDGITVLHTFEVTQNTWGWSWIGLALIIGAFMWAVICAVCYAPDFAFWIGTVLLVFAGIVSFTTVRKLPPVTHYKVIIDESVAYQNLVDRFEVVGQEGEIYEIVERVVNDD